ncbi:J domain-containing protein [Photobacterium chitinilyticum]|uniref:Molecular chaperone DnaJ n=1 Tax=Photobacterium chitinilyticum TaxID=2485123 RepID=A0A444JVM1_9GAMM|nr:J domain-containing protein [Photobacterium chitinilyticum]RWX57117.1 molecular chaperone DnaJ [Photobacterium chitinilyticum]
MTSFHDILGTDKNTSGADIKRRYKLLSSRLHPDKGGSKAIMQLLVQAYDKISQGKGHEEAVRTVYSKSATPESDKQKLQQLERDCLALKRANEELDRQYKLELQKNRLLAEESERYMGASEDELKWLRRENRRLTKQLDEARWKLSDTNRTVSAVPDREDVSSPLGEISPKVISQIKAIGGINLRRIGFMLMVPMLIVGLLFTLGREPWLAILALFDEPQPEPEVRVTILNSHPDDNLQSPDQPAVLTVSAAPDKPQPVQRILLERTVGVWQLRYFEDKNHPYIAVRSEKGSYIVKGCDTKFQYYRNSNLRSGRLAANLIFDRKERHFLVYNIPYGNGSFAGNWAESKSLLINREYFPNEGFADAYQRLEQICTF